MKDHANGRRRLSSEELNERRQESLSRAENGESLSNYPTIYEGFAEKGLASDQIQPRVNVFTYNAWIAKGRQVNRGEHGVKVVTYIDTDPRTDEATGETIPGGKIARSATVFHITQTKEREAR